MEVIIMFSRKIIIVILSAFSLHWVQAMDTTIIQALKKELNAPDSFFSPTLMHFKQYERIFENVLFELNNCFKKNISILPPFCKLNNPLEIQNFSTIFPLFLENFLKKEKELNTNGFYTFIHAQPNHLYFLQKVFTFLYSLKTNCEIKNFLFARLHEPFQNKKIDETEITGNLEWGFPNVLYVTHALFSNFTCPGCYPGLYTVTNLQKAPPFETSFPFQLFGCHWIYDKYSSEINALHNDYIKLCAMGNVLLIGIPKEKINQYVFPSDQFGHVIPITFISGNKITDTKIILETLKFAPELIKMDSPLFAPKADYMEFCLKLNMPDTKIDPSMGIEIHCFLPGDQEKLKELQKREEALFAKIKTDILSQEKSQTIQLEPAYGRMQILLNHMQPYNIQKKLL